MTSLSCTSNARQATAWSFRCADSVFSACDGYARVSVEIKNSNANFKSCVFRSISGAQPPDPARDPVSPASGALRVSGLNASLVLENCTMSDVRIEPIVSGAGAYVFSDNAQNTVRCSMMHITVCHIFSCRA